MPLQTWDLTVALGTAPIFDDAVYLSEGLGLPVNQNEDDLDAELALRARESGIQDPYHFLCPVRDVSRALSTLTIDSDHRSSISFHSQETHSTSFTSAPSRTSKDQVYPGDRSLSQRPLPKFAQASVVPTENHSQTPDSPNLASTSGSQPRQSISTMSLTHSVHSSSSSASNPTSRRKRGTNIFAMFRRDSSTCTSRAHHGHHSRSRGEKLECGHSLSPLAIRVHVQESLHQGAQSVPQCCGIALPRAVLETVLTKEDTDLALNSALGSPDTVSLNGSAECDDVASPVKLPRVVEQEPLKKVISIAQGIPSRQPRYEAINIDNALAQEAFKSFKAVQREQFERVSTFELHQRKALSAHHQCTLKLLVAQHEAIKDEKMEQHSYDFDHMEELQIVAEHDLRKAQDQETQNVATALKYMEAYCLGSGKVLADQVHPVSEEDFRKLDRQRVLQQNLPRKHENAINVLRARQERESKRKLQKQDDDMSQLDAEHEKKRSEQEAEYAKEMARLEGVIEVRRKRLLQRWDLRYEMWRRDWEEQHSTTLNAKLEHEAWPLQRTETAKPISKSSTLAQYVHAAA